MPIPRSEEIFQLEPEIKQELSKALHAVIERGPLHAEEATLVFERAFAAFLQVACCRSTCSNGEAVYLALLALDVDPGDEVVTSPFVRRETVAAICRSGAKIRLVDINPLTLNIDVGKLERALSHRVKVLMPGHHFGQPAEMGYLAKFASRHELAIVEEAVEACGASYRGKLAGSFGEMACFGFAPYHPFGAFGESGALVIRDEKMARKLDQLDQSQQGDAADRIEAAGLARMNPLQAAILSVLLARLSALNEAQRRVAAVYDAAFAENDAIRLRAEPDGLHSIYSRYVIQADHRDELVKRLRKKGIAAAELTGLLPHRESALASCFAEKPFVPDAEAAAGRLLSLPISPSIENRAAEAIANAVIEIVSELPGNRK